MHPFEKIGETKLREVIAEFYRRVFADTMIGYLFWNVDKAQLMEREYQFVARFLGADIPYTGRPMAQAHKPLAILGGHFARRQKILSDVLAEQNIDSEVTKVWLDHNQALRPQVLSDSLECKD